MKLTFDELISLIPKKEEGTITAKRISDITGCSESYIRRRINEARTDGYPICSKRFGYYMSNDNRDIFDTINFLTHRIKTQMRAIEGLSNIKGEETHK